MVKSILSLMSIHYVDGMNKIVYDNLKDSWYKKLQALIQEVWSFYFNILEKLNTLKKTFSNKINTKKYVFLNIISIKFEDV